MNLKEENEKLKEVLELARSHIVELCTVMNIPLPDATIRRIDTALSQQAEPAPAQDEREAFESWAKTQGDVWLIVGGLQWSAGTDDYASARTNAAWAAWQERATLSAPIAQTEQRSK